MKKLLILCVFIATCAVNSAVALTDEGPQTVCSKQNWCAEQTVNTVVYDASCSSEQCSICMGGESAINLYGIITVTLGYYGPVNCDTQIVKCECTGQRTSYKCGPGYYGTATSVSTGCTKCPLHATCAGGNDSTFECERGYKSDGNKCVENLFGELLCFDGKYLEDNECKNCPVPDFYTDAGLTTRVSAHTERGAVSPMDCYVDSGTYYDAAGTIQIDDDMCLYNQ